MDTLLTASEKTMCLLWFFVPNKVNVEIGGRGFEQDCEEPI